MINIYGEQGVGRSMFVKEFAKYVSIRYIIKSKIHYHSFEDAAKCAVYDTKEFFEEQKTEANKCTGTLYILDDVDKVEDIDKNFIKNVAEFCS